MPIRVFSLDFDGCLFNKAYLTDVQRKLIEANTAFFNYATSSIKSDELVYLIVGSNRQSYRDDVRNSCSYASGSCFPALKKIATHLSKLIGHRTHPIPNLLADIYGNLELGTSFTKGLRSCPTLDAALMESLVKTEAERVKNDNDRDKLERSRSSEGHADWIGDQSKLSVLYAQMQQMALEFPDEVITYEFFDDKKEILLGLTEFLQNPQNRHFIPKNVQLVLNHYEGKDITQYCPPIQGTGEIDFDYRETVIEMAEMSQDRRRDKFFDPSLVEKLGIPPCDVLKELNKDTNKLQELKDYISNNRRSRNNRNHNSESNDTLPQPVALLDVDDTLVTGAREINTALLEQLKKSGVTQIYLFTSMSPRDIQQAVGDEKYLARDELVKILEAKGFTVHGVITPIDPVYNKGLGAAYQDIFVPQYERCGIELTETTIASDIEYRIAYTEFSVYSMLQDIFNNTIQGKADSKAFKKAYKEETAEIQNTFEQLKSKNLTEAQQNKLDTLEELFHQIDAVVHIDSDQRFSARIKMIANKFLGNAPNWFTAYYQANAAPPAKWNKGAMYAYFLANKPAWVQSCIYLDDKKEPLDTATEVNQKINPQFSLKTVPVCFLQNGDAPDKASYYAEELWKFTSDQLEKAWQGFMDLQIKTRKSNDARYRQVGYASLEQKTIENDTRVLLAANNICAEIHLLWDNEVLSRSKKVDKSTHHSKLALLTTTLLTASAALKNRNENTLKACLACAEKIDGIPSLGKKLVGLLLTLVGVLAIAAGITLSVAATAATFGLAAPLSVPVGVAIASSGAVLAAGGTFLFFNGCRKGLSDQVVKLTEALKDDSQGKQTNLSTVCKEERLLVV